jgi:hypothetical protein
MVNRGVRRWIEDEVRWPHDDGYRPHIDLRWLGVFAARIGASTTVLHRRFYVCR